MNEDKELEEAIEYLKKIAKEYKTYGDLDNPEFEDIIKIPEAIETVLKELEYVKNGEQKAMKILRKNSIGQYKRQENGVETYIIAVEDFKKILNLIDKQQTEIEDNKKNYELAIKQNISYKQNIYDLKRNSIPKKKIEDKKQWLEENILENNYASELDKDIAEYQVNILEELLEG